MQQKWNQNFDDEPMTDIPQKFLNAGCDVYMVMQLRHDEKILDERFASMRELHHHINIAPCVQKLLRDVCHGFTVKILVPFLLHRPPHSSGAERAEDFGADVSLASSASFSSVEGRWSALSSSASATLSMTAS